MRISSFVILLFVAAQLSAQSLWPRGLYCSAGPTTALGNSVTPQVAAKPYVSGFLVRISWADLEPRDDHFSWARLDSQFSRARANGNKKIALGIVNGPGAPSWLYTLGAQRFLYVFRGVPDTMPVPWDEIYLSEWEEVIAAAGARYGDESSLALVHITNATANGFEMQLPFSAVDRINWQAVQYSDARLVESWRRSIGAFGRAFPHTPLDLDVHPVLSSDSVAAAVVHEGYAQLDQRFGVFAAWWSQKNTLVYPGQYQLLQDAAARSFATVQIVASGVRDSAAIGAGGLQEALRSAIADSIHYWEVWDVDITSGVFDTFFSSITHDGNTSVMSPPRNIPSGLRILGNHPNPFAEQTTVQFILESPAVVGVTLEDALGRTVAVNPGVEFQRGTHQVRIVAERAWAPGIYVVRFHTAHGLIRFPVCVAR